MNLRLTQIAIGKAIPVVTPGGAKKGKSGKQRGGVSTFQYKGIKAFSEYFLAFIMDTLLTRVAQLRDDLESVTLIYDEINELGAGNHKHFIVMYDFDADGTDDFVKRNVFSVNTKQALMACFVHAHGQSGVTLAEKKAYDAFMGLAGSLLA
jgi:hypothetical protein